jgi:molybdenum cofactor biosynthesis protein B
MSFIEHKSKAPKSFRFSVITVSDRCYRGEAEYLSGRYIIEELSKNNEPGQHLVVPDEVVEIKAAMERAVRAVDCVVITGGTGVSKRDVTIEGVRPLFEKEVPGFGELFRRMSFEEIGTASIMSGATAGIIGGSVVYCLPGSLAAVKLGMRIISSETCHIIKHLRD